MPQPYKLFTIYAREDAQYLEELRGQLRPLEIAGRIKVWSDREINPGVDWEREIVQNLDTADIILILVSAAYYNSAYIHEKEIKYALDRHEKDEAKVLPVIVRPCSFLDDPIISRLQVLPTDGKPVTSHHWRERDDAWLDVVAGVKRTIELMQQAEGQREAEARKNKEKEKHFRDEAKERAEQERLAQIRREQEEKARRIELTAWQQAVDADDISAYESYILIYPQGQYAQEARSRIKGLKREMTNPVSWKRYVIISCGVLGLMLFIWLGLNNQNNSGDKDQSTSSALELNEKDQSLLTDSPTTTIEYEDSKFDFGTANEGDVVRHLFKFKNTGDNPLIISNAKGSCGCTVPTWPKDPIPPGARSEIAVEFNTKGKPGAQSKRVTVTANTNPTDTYLEINGSVNPKE